MTDSGARVNGEVVHSDGTVGGRHRMTVEPTRLDELWEKLAHDLHAPIESSRQEISHYRAEIEKAARAAALREVAEWLLYRRNQPWTPGLFAHDEEAYNAALEDVNRHIAILTEATDTSATRVVGASE